MAYLTPPVHDDHAAPPPSAQEDLLGPRDACGIIVQSTSQQVMLYDLDDLEPMAVHERLVHQRRIRMLHGPTFTAPQLD
eukprot:8328965-Karenia_brevis.AAC.1